jgi:opacity protein-like surface antigen
MKKILMAAIAAMTLGYAGGDIVAEPEVAVAPALTGLYISGGYAYLDAEATDVNEPFGADFSNNAVDLRIGYNVNEYFAVEGRYAIGASDDLTGTDDGYSEVIGEADMNTWGIFLKPQYPVTKEASVYALIGYGQIDGDATSFDGYSEDISESGFQWGLGAKYAATQNVEVFIDYINAFDDTVVIEGEDVDLDVYTVTIGLTYKF